MDRTWDLFILLLLRVPVTVYYVLQYVLNCSSFRSAVSTAVTTIKLLKAECYGMDLNGILCVCVQCIQYICLVRLRILIEASSYLSQFTIIFLHLFISFFFHPALRFITVLAIIVDLIEILPFLLPH